MSFLMLRSSVSASGRKDSSPLPEVLLQAEIVLAGQPVSDGTIVTVAALPWLAIYAEVSRDPKFMFFFAQNPRKFEEFIAGAYDQAGWDVVILTPRSNDGGRDVIASKDGFGSIRFLEQTKAYSPGHLVTHDDVRAMLGVLSVDSNSSKGLITTTSDFQPTIKTSPDFARFMPHRLELKNGNDLQTWLADIVSGKE
jgi:restriction system protein